MKHFGIVIFIIFSKFAFAHQPDLSTVIISATDKGQVLLQINSSLTAFQSEIKYINGEGAYQTPEEFQDLVIQHFNENFTIILNEKDTLTFHNPEVFLGHETKIVTEIKGVPKNIERIYLKNGIFKDIHNNQSTVIFYLEGFPQKQNYTLSNDNNQELSLKLKNGEWEDFDNNKTNLYLKGALFITILISMFSTLLLIRLNRN